MALSAWVPPHTSISGAWKGARTLLLPGFLGAFLLPACGANHHLAEYDFREARVAMVAVPAPSPEVLSDLDLRVDRTDLFGTAIRVGTGIAREVTLDDFRARVDSAATTVNVAGRMAGRTLEGAARYLRGSPVEASGDADYEFELRIRTYGFVADGWDSRAYLSLEGDLLFLDGPTGRIIWSTQVTATNPLQSTSVRVDNPGVGNVVTALNLSRMSREEIEAEMEVLADVAADALMNQLVRDLDDAREG